METIVTLAAVAAVHFLAVASPGPSLVVLVQTAIAESRASAIKNAIGFGLGTFVWAAAALFGLETLFSVAPWLYLVLKFTGALFLIYLAYRVWKGADDATFAKPENHQPNKPTQPTNHYLLGFVTQMANPKVVIFFGSIFATVLPRHVELGMLISVIVLVFAIETIWYTAMAFAFSAPRIRKQYACYKSTIDRVSASFLGMIGIGLLVDRK